jgi:transposase-like protein
MRQSKPPYDAETRERVVELARAGRSARSLALDFGCTERSIRQWRRQADLDEGRLREGPTTLEKKEIARLRRENQQLRQERDILKKASAWSVREAALTSSRLTDS